MMKVRSWCELRQRKGVGELPVGQPVLTSTEKRCISGTAELPPPIAEQRQHREKSP